MQCDVIVYNITEHTDLIDEATWAISGNNSSDFLTIYLGCISKHGDDHVQMTKILPQYAAHQVLGYSLNAI